PPQSRVDGYCRFNLHHCERPPFEIVMITFGHERSTRGNDILQGIQYQMPFDVGRMRGEGKTDRLMMSVYQQKERIVLDRITDMILFLNTITCESHAQATDISLLPIFFCHLLAVRTEP